MGLFVCFCVSLLPVVLLVLLFFSKKLLVKKLADSGASLVWGVCARCWRRGGPQKRRRQRRERSRKSARERERDKRRARTPGGGGALDGGASARLLVRPPLFGARASYVCAWVGGWGGARGLLLCVYVARARSGGGGTGTPSKGVCQIPEREREKNSERELFKTVCVCCVRALLPATHWHKGKTYIGGCSGEKTARSNVFWGWSAKGGGRGRGLVDGYAIKNNYSNERVRGRTKRGESTQVCFLRNKSNPKRVLVG